MITESDIFATLEKYVKRFPSDRGVVEELVSLIDRGAAVTDRTEFRGHITCGAILMSGDRRLLMIHHGVLNRWLFPGGHLERGDTTTRHAAIREVEEEVGISKLMLGSFGNFVDEIPLQIDQHLIPENQTKGEPAHYHFDFRYIFKVRNTDVSLDPNEVAGCQWIDPVLTPDLINDKIRTRLINLE